MYTTVPIADMTNMHGGFYVYLLLIVCLYLFIIWGIKEITPDVSILSLKIFHLVYAVVCVSLGSVVFTHSYMIKEAPPLNQKVTATFKRYVVQSEGKHNSPAYFAEFVVPEGTVLIRVPYGAPLANKVILYKN